ncbi:DUF1467 family protein [Hirschia litorea]|uniref:DUF1467 family protein n=1 Tax=Hirschia litorea TaxID=1199156 RepID=A0ABW2IHN7_9PROT
MGIVEISIVWFISSWLVFFPLISRGTVTQADVGDVVEGSEASAPIDHQLPKKAMLAVAGGAFCTFLFWVGMTSGLFSHLIELIDYTDSYEA